MPSHRNIVLSTTGAVAGYEIVRHVGPVSAQFVIGTGIFTDFFSSFSDLFGAKSKSYQEKMDRIENLALQWIRQRAAQAGANGVVGLRIDHDEISGAGKSMMMVSVAGTAVRLKEVVQEVHQQDAVGAAVTPAQLLEDLQMRRFVNEKSKEGVRLYKGDWEYLCEHPRLELASLVLEYALKPIYTSDAGLVAQQALDEAMDFFSSLSTDDAQRLLFGAIADGGKGGNAAATILARLNLVDLNLLLQALRSEEKGTRTLAVYAAQGHPPLYEFGDVEKLAEVVKVLRSRYPEVVEWREQKKLMGPIRVWVCPCGHENSENAPTCGKCKSDRFGLYSNEKKPPDVAAILSERLEVLKSRWSVTPTEKVSEAAEGVAKTG